MGLTVYLFSPFGSVAGVLGSSGSSPAGCEGGGGAACGTIAQAAMAVNSGQADYVLVYRAFNERSGRRFGAGVQDLPLAATAERAQFSWTTPFGQLTPASWVAMVARRYMHLYGATSEDFGRVAVAGRKHAANNPAAWFYNEPITLEEHQASRWIVDPLHLLDCCQESDGGQALVVVSAERARDLPNKPALIVAGAQGAGEEQWTMTSFFRDDIAQLPEMKVVADELWTSSGLRPSDIQTAPPLSPEQTARQVALLAGGVAGMLRFWKSTEIRSLLARTPALRRVVSVNE